MHKQKTKLFQAAFAILNNNHRRCVTSKESMCCNCDLRGNIFVFFQPISAVEPADFEAN